MAFISYRFARDLLLITFSSLLLILAFPNFDVGILAWVGLVPLLLVIHGKGLRYGSFLSFVWGVFFFFGVFAWILEVAKFRVLHHIILLVYMGSFYGLFGLFFCFISRQLGVSLAFLSAPFLWVFLEFLRGNLFFLALPWPLMAHSQHRCLSIIQFASITGTYGISFLIVMVNSALALTTIALFHRLGWYKSPVFQTLPRMGLITVVLSTSLLAALALLYGRVTLARPITGQEIRVSVVQGNIPQRIKWNKRYAKIITQKYTDLTREVSKDQPALIVWPETATPAFLGRYAELKTQVVEIAKEASASILTGSSEHQKFENKGASRLEITNSAYLIRPDSGMATNQRYDKIRLLPFTEYLPLKGILLWSYLKVPNIRGLTPGKEYIVFDLPPFRFGTTICWENIFPDLFRQFVKRGAQFMVNITNEARFKKSAAPYQFMAASVLRAVENRVFVIRCANTGVSCFIDPYGQIIDRVKDNKGIDLFVRGVLTRSIIPLNSKTFYTRHGDWLAWLSVLGSVVFLFVALLRKKPALGS